MRVRLKSPSHSPLSATTNVPSFLITCLAIALSGGEIERENVERFRSRARRQNQKEAGKTASLQPW